jgi:hypothetical protein
VELFLLLSFLAMVVRRASKERHWNQVLVAYAAILATWEAEISNWFMRLHLQNNQSKNGLQLCLKQ